MKRLIVVAVAVATSLSCGGGSTPGPGGVTPGPGGVTPGAADVTFAIDSSQGVHPISPLIYGVNAQAGLAQGRAALLRLGDNRWTAYNWESNASNAGADYCFQNDGYLSAASAPGAAIRGPLLQAAALGAAVLVTVPLLDHVAADKNGGSGPPACSGDVRNSGSGYLATRFKANHSTKGSAFTTTPDPADADVYQDEFVSFVRGIAGGVQVLFDLDNEPDLWAITHPEVHPLPAGYVELVSRNIEYASAVKRVWPEALVAGFVSYGWSGYLTLQNAPDRAGKGEFWDYYLAQVHAAEVAAGHKLVDVLDLHWYPEARAPGGARITGSDTSEAVVQARLQAPRSLWDPTYVEQSWIPGSIGGGAIQLIPRVRGKIAAGNPGTGIGFSEWSYGGGQDISGALAVADVLGIFGREGVALASYWPLQSNESFAMAAMLAYRSYDGAGGQFGDTSIRATTTDPVGTSVYASVSSIDARRVVLVAINKEPTGRVAAVTIAHPTPFRTAAVWTLTSAGPHLVAAPSIGATGANEFRCELPARSVSVIVPSP